LFEALLFISGVRLNVHILKVGVEESTVDDHGLNLTSLFCVVCVFTLRTDEWCVHNRLFNPNFDDKFKLTPDIL
jgi:hypothetical protein